MLPRHEPFSFSFETRLSATAETVWAHATSMEGVNRRWRAAPTNRPGRS